MVSCGKPRLDFTFPNLIFFFRPEPHVSEHCGLSPSDAHDKGLLTSVTVAMANGTREGHVGDSSPLRAHVPLAHVCSPGSQLMPAAQGHGLCVRTWEWVSFPAFSQSETSRAGCLTVKPGLNIVGTAARLCTVWTTWCAWT